MLFGWLQQDCFLNLHVILVNPGGVERFFFEARFQETKRRSLTRQRSGGFNRLDSIIFEFRLKAFQETLELRDGMGKGG